MATEGNIALVSPNNCGSAGAWGIAIQIQRFGGSVCVPQLCDVGIVTTAPVVSVTVKEMDAFSQNLFACFLRFQSAAVLLLIRNTGSRSNSERN